MPFGRPPRWTTPETLVRPRVGEARPTWGQNEGYLWLSRLCSAVQILVTGGAGFIGGHLAERFVTDGHDVVVLDNLDDFYAVDIKERTIEQCRTAADSGEGSYRFVEGDVTRPDDVEGVVDGVDTIYHQAAQAGVRRSVEVPRQYDEVNVDGTLNVLDAARQADVGRVVYASSSSVYGESAAPPFHEDHPTRPVSPYGASKLAGERYVMAYDAVYDLPAVALRYFTVYGPRMRPNMAISNFVSRCLRGESPVVYGDGSQIRDFTYVADVVDVNRTVLTTEAADGQTLNVGSTDTIDIETLATEIRDRLAPDLDIAYDERHAADADHTHADTTRAAALLGYAPSYTIREGVAAYVDWYLDNREWYEPLVVRS